jgi:hypothetical protein
MTIRCGGLPLLNPPKIGWEIRIEQRLQSAKRSTSTK